MTASLKSSLAALGILALVGSSHAATFTVDSTADAADARPGDGRCATAAGECTLRAAVQESNARRGADTIVLPPAVYPLTLAGSGEDGGAVGDLDLRDDVLIETDVDSTGEGDSDALAVIGGAAGWADRVFHVLAGANVQLSRLAILNGNAPGGGAIRVERGGTLTLVGTTVGPTAAEGGGAGSRSDDGGGIANAGTLTLRSSTVTGNTAAKSAGGIYNTGTLSLIESTVSQNTTSGFGPGAGIVNAVVSPGDAGSAVLTNSVVSGNFAGGLCGGIANEKSASLTVSGGMIANNAALAGGGLCNSGTAVLQDTSITSNIATGTGDNGGAGGVSNNASLTMSGSTISNNAATSFGGGLGNSIDGTTSGWATLTNTTVSGNTTSRGGGGIASGGTVTLNNVTIANNTANTGGESADHGGGIAGSGYTARNTIIAGNDDLASTGKAPDCSGTVASQGYNLVENGAGCSIGGDAKGNVVGKEAQLGPLQSNGGPTFTHALLAGSPALDAGNPAMPGGSGPTCATTDGRGVPRPQTANGQGGRCDIGAFELAPASAVPPSRPAAGAKGASATAARRPVR